MVLGRSVGSMLIRLVGRGKSSASMSLPKEWCWAERELRTPRSQVPFGTP